jgi:phage tail-like protein
MAETPAFQKKHYPLPAYNFRVTVNGVTESFAEVSGIVLECETVTYRHGLSFWEGETLTRYAYPKYIPVSLKKGTVAGSGFFYDWIKARSAVRPMEISLCDGNGQPMVVWRIARAVPVKLEVPTFDAGASQVAIEKLDLMVSGISVERF